MDTINEVGTSLHNAMPQMTPPTTTTFVLLFVLFAVILIYVRTLYCSSCGEYKSHCRCNHLREQATGNVGISLTPSQSQIPREVPRQVHPETLHPQQASTSEARPQFAWSSNPTVNAQLTQQIMRDIQISKGKTPTQPPTTIPPTPTPPTPVPVSPPPIVQEESQPMQAEVETPTPPTSPQQNSQLGWILFGVFGGIWCLFVIILIVILMMTRNKT
jgi:hypothetical protein